jgi:hypothetical protein
MMDEDQPAEARQPQPQDKPDEVGEGGPEQRDTGPGKNEPPVQTLDGKLGNDVTVNLYGARIESAVLGAATSAPSTHDRPTRSTGLVAPEEITAATRRFVSPEGFAAASVQLAHDRVIVMCGPRGTGKQSAALPLLNEVTDEDCYLLSPNSSLGELADYEYQRGCGYIVVDRFVGRLDEETDFDWRLVRDQLTRKKAYLVVTRSAPLAGRSELLAHIRWHAPAPGDVFRAHLPAGWPEEGSEPLQEALAAADSVRDVVALAEHLATGQPVTSALGHLSSRIRAEVDEWFDTQPTRRQILEVTTLAFTIGVDERTFEAGLLRLDRILRKYMPESPPEEKPGPEETPLPQVRHGLRENVLVATENHRGGLGNRNTLKFAKPEHHRHILTALWQRMDVVFWDAVSDWLDDAVVRPRYEVAVAVGLAELAAVALDEVFPLMDSWAQGKCGVAGQRATIVTLYLMASDDVLGPIALEIATAWITQGEPAHRWVAAMAFVGRLGVRYPHDARRRLWQVCVQSHTVSGSDVEQVFGALFGNLVHVNENAHLVLNFLDQKMTRFTQPGARPHMRSVVARTAVAVIEAKDVTTRRSSVLIHLTACSEHTEQVARLLSGVLTHRPTRTRGVRAVRGLLEDLSKSGDQAGERASALGEALRRALPEAEHESLESDFRTIAMRHKDAEIRPLVEAILNALKGILP